MTEEGITHTRREFFKKLIIALSTATFIKDSEAGNFVKSPFGEKINENCSAIYRSINSSPKSNIIKIMELMGGIDQIIEPDAIVLIKPNGQWWNQGAPNLLALKTFVELILERKGGFFGEVILAENCHRGPAPWNSLQSGWSGQFQLNSDIPGINNMNDLSSHLKKMFEERFSTCHWVDVRAGGRRVFGPRDGTGYVYCDGTGGVPLISCDNGSIGNKFRETIMTYPIFSTDKGTIIDFKNGVWEKGVYTGQPLFFVNFSALNHHSIYCGMTGSLKNYMGITDLSGGPDPHNGGKLTGKYYNFHSFPFDEWDHGPAPGMLGAEIGVFMRTIRKADLNITTAEWVGLSSRVNPPVAHTRAVLAGSDPVALDYHAAKYILYPNSRLKIHNPDDKNSPLHQYLIRCSRSLGGYNKDSIGEIKSFDFKTKEMQKEYELTVIGDKIWGNNIKNIAKYLVLRYLTN